MMKGLQTKSNKVQIQKEYTTKMPAL